MAWRGNTRVGAKFGGRHGGLVDVGGVAVPPWSPCTPTTGTRARPDLEVTFRGPRVGRVRLPHRAKPDGRGIRTVDLQMVSNLDAMAVYLYERVPVPGGSAFNWM